MRLNNPVSEQLFNCSDIYARFHRQLAPQTPNPDPTPAPSGPPCRSQILFVGQLPQWPPATPIPHSAAAHSGSSPVKKLSARARSVGTDLRHQSRTLTPPREGLSDAAGGLADRSSAGGSSGRHHASGVPSGGGVLALASFGGRHCV